jgi:hypothetical protein
MGRPWDGATGWQLARGQGSDESWLLAGGPRRSYRRVRPPDLRARYRPNWTGYLID